MTDNPRVFLAAYHDGLSPRYEVVPEGAMGAEPWVPEGAGVRVKALEWYEGKFCGQEMFYAETPSGTWMVVCYSGRGFRWTICDSQGNNSDEDWSTPELAKAAAQGDYEAEVRAALELTTEPEPTSGAYDLICCPVEDIATGRCFTGDAKADLAMAQESLRDCLKLLGWRADE